MCDSTVYLFVQKNREDIPSSQKIREILPQYLKLSDSLFSVTDEPLLIHRTSRGKPFLPQFPDLHLSVSHSGEWFVCAISNQPVGIDLQEHTLLRGETQEQALTRYCKIARRFFHPLEADFVEGDMIISSGDILSIESVPGTTTPDVGPVSPSSHKYKIKQSGRYRVFIQSPSSDEYPSTIIVDKYLNIL